MINESDSHLRRGIVRNAARAAEEVLGKDLGNAQAQALLERARGQLAEEAHPSDENLEQLLQQLRRIDAEVQRGGNSFLHELRGASHPSKNSQRETAHKSLQAAIDTLKQSPTNERAQELLKLAFRILRIVEPQAISGVTESTDAEPRLREMQRQLEEQQKVIEELRKKLEERLRGAVPPYTPQNDADATAHPDKNASSTQSSTRSIFDEGLRLAGSFVDKIPAAIDASSKTFSFYVGFVR